MARWMARWTHIPMRSGTIVRWYIDGRWREQFPLVRFAAAVPIEVSSEEQPSALVLCAERPGYRYVLGFLPLSNAQPDPTAPDVDDAGELRVATLTFSLRELDRLHTLVWNNRCSIQETVQSGVCVVPLDLVEKDLALHNALLVRLATVHDAAEREKLVTG